MYETTTYCLNKTLRQDGKSIGSCQCGNINRLLKKKCPEKRIPLCGSPGACVFPGPPCSQLRPQWLLNSPQRHMSHSVSIQACFAQRPTQCSASVIYSPLLFFFFLSRCQFAAYWRKTATR